MNQVPQIIGTQKFHRKSQKFQEKHYFVFSKRSVTSMRKCPIVQHIESDSGHSTKWLKEGGTTRICKTMKYNDLHLSPTFCVLVKTEVVPIKMNSH